MAVVIDTTTTCGLTSEGILNFSFPLAASISDMRNTVTALEKTENIVGTPFYIPYAARGLLMP